ncbi:MAG: GNAT family N-acetyltransferase [Clostridium sp.]
MGGAKIVKVEWEGIKSLYEEYLEELGYKNDGFHNSMLFEGEGYGIYIREKCIGFCSIKSSWSKGKLLRGFYIRSTERKKSGEIFNKIIEDFKIEGSLVVSNDIHYIGLAFEKMNLLKTAFDMQVFNFVYGEPENEAEYNINHIREVKKDEYEIMNKLTENQWRECIEDEKFKFYKIISGDETLGYGSIGKMINNKKNVDIGNYTLPKHRKKGVGRSMMINLSKIALSKKLIPVAGCWHKNKESIKTLISSGFIPENGIFYIRFC